MRIVLILLICGFSPVTAGDPVRVPRSVSPDGKTALYYYHDPAKGLNEGYEFLFGDAKSFLPSSSNLMPSVPQDCTTTTAMEKMDSAMLLGGIGAHFEAARQNILWDPAFAYRIAWSPDSQWVSIEGGSHKFWKVLAYHHHQGDYQSVALRDETFQKYFDEYQPENVADRGAAAAIRRISTQDEINAYWLGNGELAMNVFPFLLRDARYQRMDMGDLFFVIRFREDSAAITGYCH
jgi:hypothetical protein